MAFKPKPKIHPVRTLARAIAKKKLARVRRRRRRRSRQRPQNPQGARLVNPKRLPKTPNFVTLTILTELGEITAKLHFISPVGAGMAFNTLTACYNCVGASLTLEGKFQGGLDGPAS